MARRRGGSDVFAGLGVVFDVVALGTVLAGAVPVGVWIGVVGVVLTALGLAIARKRRRPQDA